MDNKSALSQLNIEYCGGDFSNFKSSDDMFYPKDTIYDIANKIYFIVSGKHGFIIDPDGENKTVIISSGQMIFIHAGVRHKMFVPEGETFEMYWIRFGLNTFENNFFDLYNFDQVVNVKDIGTAISIMRSIIINARKEDLKSQLKSKAEIINLSLEFLNLANATPRSTKVKSIPSIVKYIDANLNLNFTIESLAEMAHLHPYHFIKKFKAELGITPMKYITTKRINQAQTSLENTTMSISAIMANCGFNDVSHFSKTFKKYKGMSPSHFRSVVGKTAQIRAIGKNPSNPPEIYKYHQIRLTETEKISRLNPK